MPNLQGPCLFLVIGWQRYSPNVLRLYKFDPAVQRVLRIDINDSSRGTLIRQVDADRDSRSITQPSRCRDQRSMKIDDYGLTLACPTLCATLDGDTTFRETRVLRRDSRNVIVETMSDRIHPA
jgi:hypothetical protein